MPSIQLNQVNIVVRDMAASLAFYRTLGLTIRETEPQWADSHRNAEGTGPVDIDFDSSEFAAQWDSGWPGGGGVVLGFSVETREAVDEVYAAVTGAGYASQQPPFDAFWGARYAVVQDPDGLAVGIMSPRDAALTSPQPDAPA